MKITAQMVKELRERTVERLRGGRLDIVVATETGPNTSVFTASIATATGAPVPDGVLQLADGEHLAGEPRIELISVTASSVAGEPNRVDLNIHYRLRFSGAEDQFNLGLALQP